MKSAILKVLTAVFALVLGYAGDASAAATFEWNLEYRLNPVSQMIKCLPTGPACGVIKAAKRTQDDGSWAIFEYDGPPNPKALTQQRLRAKFDAIKNVYQEFRYSVRTAKSIVTLHADYKIGTYWHHDYTSEPETVSTFPYSHKKHFYSGIYSREFGPNPNEKTREQWIADGPTGEFVRKQIDYLIGLNMARISSITEWDHVFVNGVFTLKKTYFEKHLFETLTTIHPQYAGKEVSRCEYSIPGQIIETKQKFDARDILLSTTVRINHYSGSQLVAVEIDHVDHLNPAASYKQLNSYDGWGLLIESTKTTVASDGVTTSIRSIYGDIAGGRKVVEQIKTVLAPDGSQLSVTNSSYRHAPDGSLLSVNIRFVDNRDPSKNWRRTEFYAANGNKDFVQLFETDGYTVKSTTIFYYGLDATARASQAGDQDPIAQKREYAGGTVASSNVAGLRLVSVTFMAGAKRKEIVDFHQSFGKTGLAVKETTIHYYTDADGSVKRAKEAGEGAEFAFKEIWSGGSQGSDNVDGLTLIKIVYADGTVYVPNRIVSKAPQPSPVDPILIQKNAVVLEKKSADPRFAPVDPLLKPKAAASAK